MHFRRCRSFVKVQIMMLMRVLLNLPKKANKPFSRIEYFSIYKRCIYHEDSGSSSGRRICSLLVLCSAAAAAVQAKRVTVYK